MEEQIQKIESELEKIKQRNTTVETDKAWEVSSFRKVSIAIITYIIASAIMYFINVQNYLLNACIPTLGYLLSTMSLPIIKSWWIKNYSPQRSKTQEQTKNLILFYEKEFYMFSNFSSFAVQWRGTLWMTSEHAYQAAHFDDPAIIEEIKNARSAHDSKKIVSKYQDRKKNNWHEMKVAVMEEIVRAKLSQHFYIQKKLLQTEDREIIEDSPKDSFWGWGADQNGSNHLGKIWMKLRDELREGKIPLLPEEYK